ncbi:MAG: hypothetical protein KDJ88_04150 [Bauldia sp.]|nr:hypothetical protein [Bauldia sp.]
MLANGHVGLAGLTENTPVAIAGLVAEIGFLGEDAAVGFAEVGGRVALMQAMIAEAGLPILLVTGVASRGSEGGAAPAVAEAIAERVRRGRGVRVIDPATELDPELMRLAAQRRTAATALAASLGALRETVAEACPGLERILDLDPPGPLVLLHRFSGANALRMAGWDGALAYLRDICDAPNAEAVVDRAFTAIRSCTGPDGGTERRTTDLAGDTLRAYGERVALDHALLHRSGLG